MNSPSTLASPASALTLNEGYFSRRTWADWLFALLAVVGALFAFSRYHAAMDVYEKAILAGSVPAVIWLGWFWRPLRHLMMVVAVLALIGIMSYDGGDLRRADTVF